MANGKTILVVDDDPGARHLLKFVLAKTSCEIICVSSGAQAMKLATHQTVDLLVTDIMMSEMNGFELTRTLRQLPAYAELPVILLSARGQIDYLEEIGQNDRVVMMTKPFSPIELIAQIKLLLKL